MEAFWKLIREKKIPQERTAAIQFRMASTIGWELYRTFLAVLDEGSLSSAARVLGLTQPTVGRHVDALEAMLGLPLFTRSQAGLLPTDGAHALRSHAEAMQRTAASLERVAREFGAGVKGPVRISASEVIGVEVLPPILRSLTDKHPGLEHEVVLSNDVQDLVKREADIAVRMAPPKQDVLLASRVGDTVFGLHASPEYLKRRGAPKSVAELAQQHVLIGFDRETPFLRAARSGLPWWGRDRFAYRCDSDLAQLALIRAGAGIGVCQVALARREPKLVRVLPDKFSVKSPTWIVMHADLRANPRFRSVFDGLVVGLRAYLR
jgi:DNA-binding transcriptional LysR family regulator